MTTYELLDLVMAGLALAVGGLTLCVLWRHFVVLRAYAADTAMLATAAVEQMSRPCVVLKQSPDSTADAVFEGTTQSLDGQHSLGFVNVGTAPAVNVRYVVEGMEAVRLPEMAPGDVVDSKHPINALSEGTVTVTIDYESIPGSRFRNEQCVEDRRWIRESLRRVRPRDVVRS